MDSHHHHHHHHPLIPYITRPQTSTPRRQIRSVYSSPHRLDPVII